jgi:hypothetical protein
MSINNSEELNKYYKIINELVDDYVEKHKIRPSKLVSYLKPGSERFKKFLIKNQLESVNGSDIILRDVLVDRSGMEEDGVYTFEKYKYFESTEFKITDIKKCLYKGIEKADIKYEKAIADYFDINLGDIDILDSEKHEFKISDWQNDNWDVVVYSEEDIVIIKNNLVDHVLGELKEQTVSINEIIDISLDRIIDEEEALSKLSSKFTVHKTNEVITSILKGYKFEAESKDYYFWVR